MPNPTSPQVPAAPQGQPNDWYTSGMNFLNSIKDNAQAVADSPYTKSTLGGSAVGALLSQLIPQQAERGEGAEEYRRRSRNRLLWSALIGGAGGAGLEGLNQYLNTPAQV